MRDVSQRRFLQRRGGKLEEAWPEPIAASSDVLDQSVSLEGLEKAVSCGAGEPRRSHYRCVGARPAFHRVDDRDRSVEHADLGVDDLACSGRVC
jgi:hypothetical protein